MERSLTITRIRLRPLPVGGRGKMTRLLASLRIALRALMVNKMRSALTMLGIIIGVGAVIAMIAVGSGAKKRIADQIASMGSNLLIVLSGSSTSGGLRFGSGTVPTLTVDDAKAILNEIPAVKYVAPTLGGGAQVVFGNQNWSTIINGTTPEALEIREWSLAAGRSFTQQDVDGATKVCLLGKTVVDNLFGGIDPIGQIIRIKMVPFTVVGVLAPKGQSTQGQDQDDTIIVPLTTAQKKLFGMQFPGMVRLIMVQATAPEAMKDVEDQINDLLRQRHHIQPKQDNDFSVRNLTEIMSTAGTISECYVSTPWCYRLHLSDRWRDRNYEHHARFGDGEDEGDWHSNRCRCKGTGYPPSISHRILGAQPDWGNIGNRDWSSGNPYLIQFYPMADTFLN